MFILDLLFAIFIAPLTSGMAFVFGTSYELLGSYGASLIALSVVVGIFMTPLIRLAEAWQKADVDARQKFSDKADEIKLAFKGQERFMMTKTLYRQHNYHPLSSVRTSMGLLIQIPFFFAAFYLLSNYTALEGVSFLVFADLSRPDALFSIGSFSINVMPFVMTLVNLFSLWILRDRFSKPERKNAIIVTSIFLLLLYNLPVALVFYWTVNNVVSMVRNLLPLASAKLSSRYRMKLSARWKRRTDQLRSGGSRIKSVWNRIFNWVGIPPYGQLIVCIIFLVDAVMFLVLNENITLAGNGKALVINLSATLAKVLILGVSFFVLFLLVESVRSWKHQKGGNKSRVVIYVAVLTVLVLTAAELNANASISNFRYFLKIILSQAVALLAGWCGIRWWKDPAALLTRFKSSLPIEGSATALASIALTASLIFIHTPISLLLSDLNILGNDPLSDFFITQIKYLIYALALAMILYRSIQSSNKALLSFFFVYLSLVALVYSYLFIGDYGAIDAFKFQHVLNLYKHSQGLFDIAILSALFLGAFYLTQKRLKQYLVPILIVLNISVLTVSVTSLFEITDTYAVTAKSENTSTELPDYNDQLLSFSRDKQNVVVLMLDMLSGDAMESVVTRYTDIPLKFDGFVWYRNTLSTGAATFLGEPAIHGGHRYTARAINSREVVSLRDEITRGYGPIVEAFHGSGFDISLAGIPGFITLCSDINQYWDYIDVCLQRKDTQSNYLNHWLGTHKKIEKWYTETESMDASTFLSVIGLFKAAPYSLRQHIYSNRWWLGLIDTQADNAKSAINNHSFIDTFEGASNTQSKNSTFKYIQSASTHAPHALSDRCQILHLTKGSETKADNISPPEPFKQQAACTLRAVGKWLDWFKENGIYDNTKFIIVSDHSFEGDSIGVDRAHAALLVKDFNDRSAFRIDDSFMSNADTPAIACSAIGSCAGIMPDPTITPIENRELWFNVGAWNPAGHSERKFKLTKQYRVKDNIFESANWTQVK